MEEAEEGQQCHELASPSSPQTPEELWARWKEAAEEAPQPESLRWEEGAACVCVCVGGVSVQSHDPEERRQGRLFPCRW